MESDLLKYKESFTAQGKPLWYVKELMRLQGTHNTVKLTSAWSYGQTIHYKVRHGINESLYLHSSYDKIHLLKFDKQGVI